MPELLFSSNFEKSSYRLVELSSDELVNAFESGSPLIIKGQHDEEAVLCTASSTFSVRQVNTSNSQLLAEPSSNALHVMDDISSSISLQPCLARLGEIDKLLQPTMYNGPESESKLTYEAMYTYNDLLKRVQASDAELKAGLEERNAFTLDGMCRLINPGYLYDLLKWLVINARIHELDITAIRPDDAHMCIRQNADAPDPVITACIYTFAERQGDVLCLDEKKVCRFLGQILFESDRSGEWRVEEFMEQWNKITPDDFRPNLVFLEGLYVARERAVISQSQSAQTYITYFPVAELPTDPARRFESLFRMKSHWSAEEIQPYLYDLAPDPKKRDALLVKFARTHKSDGKQLYGSRIK